MPKIKTCLKLFFSVFVFFFTIFFALKSNVYAAADKGETTGYCELGAHGSCPKIGYFTRANGTKKCPRQAEACECSIVTGKIGQGQWTTCDYSSSEFYDESGSCAANNYKIRKCNFTQQSIACNSSSVSVKYTCGAWEKGDCSGTKNDCIAGQKQYKPKGDCETSERICENGIWGDWDDDPPHSVQCLTDQCWDGTKCADKDVISRSCSGNVTNAQSGTQTRTATCAKGTGWSYGSWSGICTCKNGYTWNGSSCVRDNSPSVILYGCQAVPNNGGASEGNYHDDSYTWIGGYPSTAPSQTMYAVVEVKGVFYDSSMTEHISSATVTLNFSAGSAAAQTKEFYLGLPAACRKSNCQASSNSQYECSLCSYTRCTATLHSSGWQ